MLKTSSYGLEKGGGVVLPLLSAPPRGAPRLTLGRTLMDLCWQHMCGPSVADDEDHAGGVINDLAWR